MLDVKCWRSELLKGDCMSAMEPYPACLPIYDGTEVKFESWQATQPEVASGPQTVRSSSGQTSSSGSSSSKRKKNGEFTEVVQRTLNAFTLFAVNECPVEIGFPFCSISHSK